MDTVTNRSDKSKVAGSSIVSLSASDSGVLRDIAKSEASTVDSKIDLVHDSNAPNAKKSKSQAIAKATSPITTPQKTGPGGSSPLLKPIEKGPNAKPSPKPNVSPQAKPIPVNTIPAKPIPRKQKSNIGILIGVGVLTLILFAGIVVAVLANR